MHKNLEVIKDNHTSNEKERESSKLRGSSARRETKEKVKKLILRADTYIEAAKTCTRTDEPQSSNPIEKLKEFKTRANQFHSEL